MREKLVEFVLENRLSPFADSRSLIKKKSGTIYRTKAAQVVHSKVLKRLSTGFVFKESFNIWDCFGVDSELEEIKRRQGFFGNLKVRDSDFLRELEKPRMSWRPRYDVVVVTEDEGTFVTLNELGCAVQLLVSDNDVAELERYDVVQVVDCEDFKRVLERLPQSVFLSSIDEAYLERFLEELSGWRENFAVLNGANVSREIKKCLDLLVDGFALLENKEGEMISEGDVERVLEEINEEIGEEIKEMTISGEGLMKMLSEGKMPVGILKIVRGAIEKSGISEHVFNLGVPVTIDYKELEHQIKMQSATEFSDMAEKVRRSSEKLRNIPEILKKLEAEILVEDFCNEVADGIEEKKSFPSFGEDLFLEDGLSIFLDEPQPISFILNKEAKCSILTGANSGGKTTLLEHVLQNISLFRMGLPVVGEFRCPVFDDVYYFAKSKGSASKGAFETLLTQMSRVGSRRSEIGNVLILADEIEAVTEPGVAGKIISATAEYFVEKGYFMILATHLGAEIAKSLLVLDSVSSKLSTGVPFLSGNGIRVDGIEAKGLDEDFNLIVNHNPVLGRLASSTPELIVERMACSEAAGGVGSSSLTNDLGYLKFLFEKIKK